MPARKQARVGPVNAAIARLMALTAKAVPPHRIAREVEIIVTEWLGGPEVDRSDAKTWLDELREQIVAGVVDAEEQVSYVDPGEATALKQASLTLAALVATRDAVVRAQAAL